MNYVKVNIDDCKLTLFTHDFKRAIYQCHEDFGSKLPQIKTKYLCRTQMPCRTLRGRCQVNCGRDNTP